MWITNGFQTVSCKLIISYLKYTLSTPIFIFSLDTKASFPCQVFKISFHLSHHLEIYGAHKNVITEFSST